MNEKKNPYAEILIELEGALWDQDIRVSDGIAQPYEYDNETFRACIKIFTSSFLWKIWENVDEKEIASKWAMAEKAGNDIRSIILKYAGIDSRKL